MSSHYKSIRNGRGTNLIISEKKYLSIGKDGKDIMIRGNGTVFAFDDWDNLIRAINLKKAAYYYHDMKGNILK